MNYVCDGLKQEDRVSLLYSSGEYHGIERDKPRDVQTVYKSVASISQ